MLTLSGRVVSLESREWDYENRSGVTHTMHVASDGSPPTACVVPERLFQEDTRLRDQLVFGAVVQCAVRPFIKVNNDRPPTLRLNVTSVYVVEPVV